MKFEIEINEQLVSQSDLAAWINEQGLCDVELVMEDAESGIYKASVSPNFYQGFGQLVEELIIIAEQGIQKD